MTTSPSIEKNSEFYEELLEIINSRTSFRILLLLSVYPHLTLKEIYQKLALPRTTAYRHLSSLEELGLVKVSKVQRIKNNLFENLYTLIQNPFFGLDLLKSDGWNQKTYEEQYDSLVKYFSIFQNKAKFIHELFSEFLNYIQSSVVDLKEKVNMVPTFYQHAGEALDHWSLIDLMIPSDKLPEYLELQKEFHQKLYDLVYPNDTPTDPQRKNNKSRKNLKNINQSHIIPNNRKHLQQKGKSPNLISSSVPEKGYYVFHGLFPVQSILESTKDHQDASKSAQKRENFLRLLYAKTPKITDEKGQIPPNSITSLEMKTLGAVNQAILIRGYNTENPVLLFLHGGPGYPEMGIYTDLYYPLEKSYTLVYWDQRGSGKSYSEDIPPDTMTFDQIMSDAYELILHLRDRFNKDKIFLMGHSWGSLLVLRLAKKYPNLFHAVNCISPITNIIKSEKRGYEFALQKAREDNNQKALKELATISNLNVDDKKYLDIQRKWLGYYGGAIYGKKGYEVEAQRVFRSHEYSWRDAKKFKKGEKFSMKNLFYHKFSYVNLFEEIQRLEVPLFFMLGRNDYQGDPNLAIDYLEFVEAPFKEVYWFERSAHCPNFSEPSKLIRILQEEKDLILGK